MIKNGDRVRIIRPNKIYRDCIKWVENILNPVMKEGWIVSYEQPSLNSIGEVICSGIFNDGSKNILLYGIRIGNKIFIMQFDGIRKI
jgi:hypothetical protein